MSQHRYQCTECAIINFYRRTRVVDGCLEWMGARNREGYGRLKVDTVYRQAHRRIWELVKGPIPEGMLVCHRCDNPSCVDVGHLFLGTNADNSEDKIRKGRHARGATQPLSKLDVEKVKVIKGRIQNGHRLVDIAKDYGVTPETIGAIKYGRSWAYVTP